MLAELKINNYALIDDLHLTFSPGLNILSGETGAGKSIIIGALNLILGERATVELIRQGEESAYIEAFINCGESVATQVRPIFEQAGLELDDELIVAREIYRNGRGVARVNGRAVPVSFLKELGQILVDLHGQHQHQSLLRADKHIDLLDSFGGDAIAAYRDRLGELYRRRSELQKNLVELGENSAERERRIDICAFQLKEINEAGLQTGEDQELRSREKVMANAEKLSDLVSRVYGGLYGGEDEGLGEALIDQLNRALQMLNEAAGIDQSLEPIGEMVAAAAAQVEEAAHDLRDYQLKIEYEPGELAEVQERINLINGLKKKYGPSIEEVLDFAGTMEEEINKLVNSEAMAARLEQELAELERSIKKECMALRELRKETSANLEKLVEKNLQELALPNAQFVVKLTEKVHFSPTGLDHVEFLFSANPGEEVKPLAKIISGGEVSRVMLSLKAILARQDLVPTLVFDEVDSGVGGATIQAVAEKLAGLARHHQVMCVTHSPQIASMADCHYLLYKETSGERTVTRTKLLKAEQRREELARMLDGAGIDQVSLQHVDNLLERAERFKHNFGEG